MREKVRELLRKAWAKDDGTSIREHTDALLKNYENLKNLFGDLIEKSCPESLRPYFWEALRLSCEYHDYGKLHCHFQRKVKNKNWKTLKDVPEVRHNLLSPAFVECKDEKVKLIVQKVVLHHHEVPDKFEEAKEVLKKEFNFSEEEAEVLDYLGKDEEKFLRRLAKTRFKESSENLRKFYTLLKGLLLRIDHASSSKHVSALEIGRNEKPEEAVREYLKGKGAKLNELQNFVLQNRDKNLLVVAPTGYGKTEAGFIFLKDKGFFTLPFRVSANGIYERAKNTFGENVGLLHSSSLVELLKEKEDELDTNTLEGVWKHYQQARNFSYPLVVCTPDQIMPFVFRFGGYEKYLALLSYSRIVLDELQVYEPYTMAFIVKALEVIKDFGGKFMVMTATFPEFLRPAFEKMGVYFKEFTEEKPRHNVKLLRDYLGSEKSVELIKRLSEKGKVLVVVNTVARAQELARLIEGSKLLHSRFLQKHRSEKEKEIKEFFTKGEKGVWITTQLAEVSLDLDADYLITELSPIDSLIQRMGRCNRKGKRSIENPNVYVFTEEPSGKGSVYPKELLELTKESLKEGVWDNEIKSGAVKEVFGEKIKRTKYYETYKTALDYVNSFWTGAYEIKEKRSEAISKFRDILSLNVIPLMFREEVLKIYKRWRNSTDIMEKILTFNELQGYIFSYPYSEKLINEGRIKKASELCRLNVYWIEGEYDEHFGFRISKEKDPEVGSDDNII